MTIGPIPVIDDIERLMPVKVVENPELRAEWHSMVDAGNFLLWLIDMAVGPRSAYWNPELAKG